MIFMDVSPTLSLPAVSEKTGKKSQNVGFLSDFVHCVPKK